MELDATPIVVGIAGFVILWGAVRNKNPIDVIRLVLSGKSPYTARPLDPVAAAVAGATAQGSAVTGPAIPGGTGEATNANSSSFIPGAAGYTAPILPRTT